MNELYQQRVNRDIRAQGALTAQGKSVRKSSVRNQLLHPQYVRDYTGSYTTGFGNSDYQTHFAVLYEVSWL